MCLKPITVKTTPNPVPCGKCSLCRKRKASAWSFRLMQEYKNADNGYFITLTYDSNDLTNITITDKGFMALDRRHVQGFIKRLRTAHSRLRKEVKRFKSIRYYAAGEYGGKTGRPHYHIIIFNIHKDLVEREWRRGGVHIGGLSEASVGYTLKYISKQSQIPKHKNDDRPKEFSLMSKGLGKGYLSNDIVQWHKADLLNRMYVNIAGGKKATMARYYKDRLYTQDEREKATQEYAIKFSDQIRDIVLASPDITSLDTARRIAFENDLIKRRQPTKDNL